MSKTERASPLYLDLKIGVESGPPHALGAQDYDEREHRWEYDDRTYDEREDDRRRSYGEVGERDDGHRERDDEELEWEGYRDERGRTHDDAPRSDESYEEYDEDDEDDEDDDDLAAVDDCPCSECAWDLAAPDERDGDEGLGEDHGYEHDHVDDDDDELEPADCGTDVLDDDTDDACPCSACACDLAAPDEGQDERFDQAELADLAVDDRDDGGPTGDDPSPGACGSKPTPRRAAARTVEHVRTRGPIDERARCPRPERSLPRAGETP